MHDEQGICDRENYLEKQLLDKSSQTMSNEDKAVNSNQRQSEVPQMNVNC